MLATRTSIVEKRTVKRRQWVPCPQSMPLLHIVSGTAGMHHLRFADSRGPHCKAKPDGATAMELYWAISDRRPAALDEAKFHRLVTRTPFDVEFDPADDGKAATYYARWVSARGETGPWSLPVYMTIAV